jgi:DNA-binding NtrC family response regulator
MPVRVHIHPPDGGGEQQVQLEAGEALLVGRDPDPAAAGSGAPAPTQQAQVASSLVSANHVLLWASDEALHALDLESKNGSFLRLERGGLASLRGAADAHIFLAAPRVPSRGAAPEEVAVLDADAGAFAARVRDAVSAWLGQIGLRHALTVAVTRTCAEADEGRFSVPLADGLALEIADRDAGRTELRWDAIKSEVFPYAYEQVARWRACQAARPGRAMAFRSPGAARALREVLEAARLRVPLVLRGESGTGKTALAAIYAGRESIRPGRAAPSDGAPPFVTVHCAHLDPPLAHSTLFGAMKGSYTSAERTVVGAVKLADGGVLFLDDVDALPLETQAKLLRFLDEGRFEPLGHGQREPLVSNVCVVASTNVDLRAAVRERRFREDLYWRLHMGAVVRVPPLRERPEDVEQLLSASPGEGEARGAGRSVRDRLDPGALDLLLRRHPWRGNFRECLRFCTRVRMEPPGGRLLDRRRCEEILAEASLEPEAAAAPAVVEHGASDFERALRQAVQWWRDAEGGMPERFDELGRFCETYLKSAFVAHALGLVEADERPESFDRDRRQRLGCDLTTLKRKIDEYVALRRGQVRTGPAE